MIKFCLNILVLLSLIQCGTTGEIFLLPGVEDRACYEYPPESREYPLPIITEKKTRHEEISIIYTDEGNIIAEDGTVICRPII